MTATAKRMPADVLREARTATSKHKRANVFKAVDTLRREGSAITFAAVAQRARVSRWLVYADGVRDYIEAAQAAEDTQPQGRQRAAPRLSDASLQTDLELQRQENRALRSELERLKRALREKLGEQLDAETSESLRARVQELTTINIRAQSENVSLSAELARVRNQLSTTEDDLAAARTALRRMIKDQSMAAQHGGSDHPAVS